MLYNTNKPWNNMDTMLIWTHFLQMQTTSTQSEESGAWSDPITIQFVLPGKNMYYV